MRRVPAFSLRPGRSTCTCSVAVRLVTVVPSGAMAMVMLRPAMRRPGGARAPGSCDGGVLGENRVLDRLAVLAVGQVDVASGHVLRPAAGAGDPAVAAQLHRCVMRFSSSLNWIVMSSPVERAPSPTIRAAAGQPQVVLARAKPALRGAAFGRPLAFLVGGHRHCARPSAATARCAILVVGGASAAPFQARRARTRRCRGRESMPLVLIVGRLARSSRRGRRSTSYARSRSSCAVRDVACLTGSRCRFHLVGLDHERASAAIGQRQPRLLEPGSAVGIGRPAPGLRRR